MSGKHVCAVDGKELWLYLVNKNVYTWGTGYHGELGQGNTTMCNVPTLVEVVKNKVAKALCGDTYTVFLDCI
jgi:alpha-tubulin suppressor-like RCC1 family protein